MRWLRLLAKWLDNAQVPHNPADAIDYGRIIPFILLHLSCFAIYWVGVSTVAVVTALTLYWVRIFAIGAFYHRYFSHRTFKTNRFWQALFAILGASAVQRGPIWWAAHHRHHHQVTDTVGDPHSPWAHSFWRSHVGWFLSHKYFHYDASKARDWLRFPELCWLDRYDVVIPLCLIGLLYGAGAVLQLTHPALGCTGLQLVVWGFSVSTVATLHTTVSINSFGHKFGSRRYPTKGQSRNNLWLALITLGEGWHNNHHRYPATAQQGFFWWEIDITYYLLVLMEKLKIIKDLKRVPPHVLEEGADA